MIHAILIEPPILRVLWSIVSSIHYQNLIDLNDRELCDCIVRDIHGRICLDSSEISHLHNYLSSRIMLIRDSISSARLESIESFALG